VTSSSEEAEALGMRPGKLAQTRAAWVAFAAQAQALAQRPGPSRPTHASGKIGLLELDLMNPKRTQKTLEWYTLKARQIVRSQAPKEKSKNAQLGEKYAGEEIGEGKFWLGHGRNAFVTYLQPGRKRDALQLHLNAGGQLVQGEPAEIYDEPSGAIFVMSPGGDLLAANKNKKDREGVFHHSSFLAGGEVLGAGQICATQGIITHLNNQSGHYLPGKMHTAQVLEVLQTKYHVNLGGVKLKVLSAKHLDGIEFNAAAWLEKRKSKLANWRAPDSVDTPV
jgi:hypothetical protein